MIHHANQYAAPVTQPPPRWGLNYRLDTPSEMKGLLKAAQRHMCIWAAFGNPFISCPLSYILRPDSTHIFGVNDALNRD